MVSWTGKTSSLDLLAASAIPFYASPGLVFVLLLLTPPHVNSVCPRISHVFPGLSNSLLQGYNFLVSMHRRVIHWHAFIVLGRVNGVWSLGGWETGSESTVKNVDDEHQAEQGEYRDQDDRHCAPSFALMMAAVRHTVSFRRLKIKGTKNGEITKNRLILDTFEMKRYRNTYRDRTNRTTSSRFRRQRIVASYRANSLFATKLPSRIAGARGARVRMPSRSFRMRAVHMVHAESTTSAHLWIISRRYHSA